MVEENSYWRVLGLRKHLFVKFSAIALSLVPWSLCTLEAADEVALVVDRDISQGEDKKDAYKIDFNNVAITEYIRFVSKITGLNFVFDEQELQFAITIVSEEPTTTTNIMSALVQVLRIHGLTLLEQENNLLITKNTAVNQIATIVSPDATEKHTKMAPLVTRIFRIKNANPDNIAALIKPMVSSTALIEVSKETRQLIVTDVYTNVEKIATLLLSLDSPHSPLEIETYTAKHVAPADLIALATQILTPFSEGNPLLFVPQPDRNSIFIISTPYLIERTMTVMEDLDVTPKKTPIARMGGQASFYVYRVQNASEEQIESAIEQLISSVEESPSPDANLVETLKSMHWIKEANSLVFTGDQKSLDKLKDLLPSLDISPSMSRRAPSAGTDFFMYKPKNASGEQIEKGLHQIADKLKSSGLADPALLWTIQHMKWAKDTGTLLFTGDSATLKKVEEMVTEVDVTGISGAAGKTSYYIYKPKNQPPHFIVEGLKKIAHDLEKSNLLDPDLLLTLNSASTVETTNSVLLTGTPDALQKAEELLETVDVVSPEGMRTGEARKYGAMNYVLYSPKYQSGPSLIAVFHDFEKTLKSSGVTDPALYRSIESLRWMDQTSDLVITGDPDTIKKMQDLLVKFDIASKEKSAAPDIETIENTSFLVYKLQYHQGVDIITGIKQVATELAKSPAVGTQNLVNAINSLQWINVTNSLIATGEQDILTRLKDLIASLDVPLKQVFIEVLIIETTLGNAQTFGLQWASLAQYKNRLAMGTGNFPATNPFTNIPPLAGIKPAMQAINATRTPNVNTDIPLIQGFDLGSIGDIIIHKGQSFVSLGALLNALQTDADSTIVLNPKIIAQDTTNSTIFVGQNIPYTGSTLNVSGGVNTSVTSNIEYRDIGVNLSVTPYLGTNDIITLEISTDISSQIAATGTNIPMNGIQTTHTSLNTRVHVPDKHFVVLSGMIHDTKQHFKSGLPCLGSLPMLGWMFSTNTRSDTKDNIVIFMRPRIIHSFDEYKETTDRQENLYKDNAVLPELKEEFDDALNLVKEAENE